MGNVTLSAQSAGRAMAADMAQAEAAAIGAAAERKRRGESERSIEAILTSDSQGGKAVYWHRTITANGERRESLEVERSGAYTPRAFLRMAEKAAGQAGKGRWNKPEAVETVAAELVARTLAKTGGRMPAKGALGRKVGSGHENPDLAYLTTAARHLIASAMRGEDAGLASEAAPIGDAEESGSAELSLAELMGDAEVAAEGPRDAYLAEPVHAGADLLNDEAKQAAEVVASHTDGSPAAVVAALAAAMRSPLAKSEDLADAGYASSPAAFRKAAQRGREALIKACNEAFCDEVISTVKRGTPNEANDNFSPETVAYFELCEALANLCVKDSAEAADKHPMEATPHGVYRRPNIEWPMVTPREESPLISYKADAPDWRVAL